MGGGLGAAGFGAAGFGQAWRQAGDQGRSGNTRNGCDSGTTTSAKSANSASHTYASVPATEANTEGQSNSEAKAKSDARGEDGNRQESSFSAGKQRGS